MTSLADVAALDGLVNRDVGQALYELASAVPAGQGIVEVGSYKGKSTAYLALGALDGHGAPVTAVDPWDTEGNKTGRFGFAEPSTREAFEAQLTAVGLRNHVTMRQGFSVDVAATYDGPPIGLLFIDGDHREHAVWNDFAAWTPHRAPRATVVFDDVDTPSNPGVRVIVDRLTAAGWLADVHVRAGRLAVGTVTM